MLVYLLAALLFIVIGATYVAGFDQVSRRSPAHLPQFCLLMTVVRLLLLITFAATAILLMDDRSQSFRFVIIYIIMYAIMMAVTLTLRH